MPEDKIAMRAVTRAVPPLDDFIDQRFLAIVVPTKSPIFEVEAFNQLNYLAQGSIDSL
jgi:hypothetical protein